jgi:hypothetical protein
MDSFRRNPLPYSGGINQRRSAHIREAVYGYGAIADRLRRLGYELLSSR